MSISNADKKRLSIIHRLPCVACVQEGCQQPSPTEAHHLVDKGYRKHSGGHQSSIPLCAHHHRAEPIMGRSKRWMVDCYGPSLAEDKLAFTIRYGNERELLANIDKVING
jgi:hypothetical protein